MRHGAADPGSRGGNKEARLELTVGGLRAAAGESWRTGTLLGSKCIRSSIQSTAGTRSSACSCSRCVPPHLQAANLVRRAGASTGGTASLWGDMPKRRWLFGQRRGKETTVRRRPEEGGAETGCRWEIARSGVGRRSATVPARAACFCPNGCSRPSTASMAWHLVSYVPGFVRPRTESKSSPEQIGLFGGGRTNRGFPGAVESQAFWTDDGASSKASLAGASLRLSTFSRRQTRVLRSRTSLVAFGTGIFRPGGGSGPTAPGVVR
ncbi:hypothetical protein GGTG_12498 [Gaeumannomyces tritici R3-111a-1]|uniref:Uncharacterized protein n=1 Tax=Gaeumannomyces tritici (strain R3-111a-1) TaxID=644352 RepID=J3PG72_GAET3|nr:hypothetical protein GGTG_12498 [Gaeumannomyces tritici R3-111a-1]EJT70326.1 hypothetical protein GGTG_12498 [Gaeumannomyces tritici R3-111a-1]